VWVIHGTLQVNDVCITMLNKKFQYETLFQCTYKDSWCFSLFPYACQDCLDTNNLQNTVSLHKNIINGNEYIVIYWA
jgi:hypothetical protein